jgi:rare lipoprotein A
MKRKSFLLLLVLTCIAVIAVAQTGDPLRQEGMASWYGQEFAGRPTASGEIFNPAMFTAAHPNLPFGTILTVTNTQNMRQVTVRVNDRGPFVAARIIDLSTAAAEALDMIHAGVVPVIVERALDITLGPVGASAMASPVPIITLPQEIVIAPAAEPLITPPVVQRPAVPQQGVMFPAPAANIIGGIPPANSTKSYRLQVGAYRIPRNAVDAFTKLKNVGLNPAYEPNGDFYRVVLAGLRASEIQSIAQTLGNAGFREAIIREE